MDWLGKMLLLKCPYTYLNDILSEKLKTAKEYIIYFNENDVVVVNNHNYYHQIQDLLHILNRRRCNLCIWTIHEAIIVDIYKEETWAENMAEQFFTHNFVPHLLQNCFYFI